MIQRLGPILVLCACAAEPAPDTPQGQASPTADGAAPATPRGAPPTPPPAPDPVKDAAALARAQDSVAALSSALKGRLVEALEGGVPADALTACADEAQGLTVLAAERGVRLGRASLRLRNPRNTGPDWVQTWLKDTGEPATTKEIPAVAEVVDTPTGRIARVIKPVPVAPLCLTCHGPQDTLDTGVKERLAQRYPQDRATGYAAGQLRGVIWAESRVR